MNCTRSAPAVPLCLLLHRRHVQHCHCLRMSQTSEGEFDWVSTSRWGGTQQRKSSCVCAWLDCEWVVDICQTHLFESHFVHRSLLVHFKVRHLQCIKPCQHILRHTHAHTLTCWRQLHLACAVQVRKAETEWQKRRQHQDISRILTFSVSSWPTFDAVFFSGCFSVCSSDCDVVWLVECERVCEVCNSTPQSLAPKSRRKRVKLECMNSGIHTHRLATRANTSLAEHVQAIHHRACYRWLKQESRGERWQQ